MGKIMRSVRKIVFRNLTDADFFNINKPRGTEASGGGQAYIDFPVRSISINNWHDFFDGTSALKETEATQGQSWEFPIFSIGVNTDGNTKQELKIYQRRAASVSITSQKIYSNRANRIDAWNPVNKFPKPFDNTDRNQCPEGLIVYLVSTFEGEVWAGWYLNDGTTPLPVDNIEDYEPMAGMLSNAIIEDGHSGMLSFNEGEIALDISSIETPFILQKTTEETKSVTIADNGGVDDSIDEEEIDQLFDKDIGKTKPIVTEEIVKVRKRNSKIVKELKKLYKHKCQVTGDEFAFNKKNGVGYTEAHHLIPLGDGGYDRPENLVILNPLVHKWFHYADIEDINLNNIKHLDDGSAELDIVVNKETYTIYWHAQHADLFKDK